MLYIIDTSGTTQLVQTEPIYQGSTGVNSITLLAPFPSNYQIVVSALLPNGIPLKNTYPMTAKVLPLELKDINENKLTCFNVVLDEIITAYPGNVKVQFTVYQGHGKKLNTYTTSFNVGIGIPTEEPNLPTDGNYVDAILQYLAEINGNALISVVYVAPDNYLLTPNSLDVNDGTEYTSDNFTPNGTLEDGSGNFFVMTSQSGGFRFYYDSPVNIYMVQLFAYSPQTVVFVEMTFTLRNGRAFTQRLAIEGATQSLLTHPRINVNIKDVTSIIFEFDGPISIKAVQVYSPNIYGEYIFKFRDGNTESVISPDATLIEGYALAAESSAQAAKISETNAYQFAENALNNDLNSSDSATSAANSAAEARAVVEVVKEDLKTANENSANALTTAQNAESIAQNAETVANNALNQVPKVYFETSYRQIVKTALLSNLKSGDVLVNINSNSPDFFVVSADKLNANAVETITYSMLDLSSGVLLPMPNVGDKFLIENVDSNGVPTGEPPKIGIIAIESGGVTAAIEVDTELSDTSTNPVENRVIDQAIRSIEAYAQGAYEQIFEHVTEYESKVNSALAIQEVQAGQISSLQVQTGDMKLVGEKILTEPDSTIDFTELKPYKEIFIQLEVLCDKGTNGNILSRTLDVHQNYWMFSGSMSLPVNDVRYFYIYAKEIVERQWLVMYPDGLLSNVSGEYGANKNCKISYATRKEQATRFPTSVRIGLPSTIATNFVEGTVARIYTREGENEE